MKNAITEVEKFEVCLQTGELLVLPNMGGLHSRDMSWIIDEEAARQRYLLKTYNFRSYKYAEQYREYFKNGLFGLVVDAKIDNDYHLGQ